MKNFISNLEVLRALKRNLSVEYLRELLLRIFSFFVSLLV